MIPVTQQEAEIIRARCPGVGITKTMKNHSNSKRGKRYVAAYKNVLNLLSEIRGVKVTDD